MESVNYVDSRATPLGDCDQRRTERMKYEFFWFLDGNGILPKRPIDRGWRLFLQIIDFDDLRAVSLVHGVFLMKVATIFFESKGVLASPLFAATGVGQSTISMSFKNAATPRHV